MILKSSIHNFATIGTDPPSGAPGLYEKQKTPLPSTGGGVVFFSERSTDTQVHPLP